MDHRNRQFARFTAVDSDVDRLREHYARTLKPVNIHPVTGNSTISVEDLHVPIGDFDVWAGTCSSGMDVSFIEAPDAYALYLPLTGAAEFVFGGKQFHSAPGTVFLCDLAKLDSLHLLPGRSHIGVAFGKNTLTQYLSTLTGTPVLQDVHLTGLIDASSGKGAKIASMCQLLWQGLVENPALAATEHSNELFIRALMTTVLETVPHCYTASMQRKPPPPLPRHVKRAIEFMSSEISRPLTIEEIAFASGVSVRTLQVGFQQFKDMTPLTYMRHLRLEGVRRELSRGHQLPESISEVAKRWGFVHMGRFASLYRDAFGETPRMTILKK